MNSPAVKSFGDRRIAEGETCLVADLSACTSMDSTFMGTLAGLAARISTRQGGRVQVAEAGERNRRSLEDLGLDNLMDVNPPAAEWKNSETIIRACLHNAAAQGQSSRDRMHHVLNAHRELSDISEKNAKIFSNVVETLEHGLEQQEDDKPRGE